jgi:hypothetical protein
MTKIHFKRKQRGKLRLQRPVDVDGTEVDADNEYLTGD